MSGTREIECGIVDVPVILRKQPGSHFMFPVWGCNAKCTARVKEDVGIVALGNTIRGHGVVLCTAAPEKRAPKVAKRPQHSI